jgi:hypothetical protein
MWLLPRYNLLSDHVSSRIYAGSGYMLLKTIDLTTEENPGVLSVTANLERGVEI